MWSIAPFVKSKDLTPLTIGLLLFLIVLCLGTGAIAHPHVFVVQQLKIVFDNEGLAGFWVDWHFDEMFSNIIATDYDQNQNGLLEPAEVAVVKEEAFSYIAEYNYFIFVKIDDRPFKVKWIKDFNAVLKNGTLSYHFFVPCHVKAHKSYKQIVIATYDPSNYTSIFFAKKQPILVENENISMKKDKSISIYFDMVNLWTLSLKFRLKS